MAKIAVVLGGGSGTRAGGTVPKQFQLLNGKSMLSLSIEAMCKGGAECCFVVLHPEFLRDCETELQAFPVPAFAVCGGKTRWHSVKNALLAIEERYDTKGHLIAIHDGARPLVPCQVVETGWEVVEQYGAVVPVVPVTDSLRQILPDGSSMSVDRSVFRAVQTPQVFKSEIIIDAYRKPFKSTFTDDASVVEENGGKITLFPGDAVNIKVTHPADFDLARIILSHLSNK